MREELVFADREDAGRKLGLKLSLDLTLSSSALVLGLVRGGAITAEAVAAELGLPWDVLIVRKIGAPQQPEYAVGAYAESGAKLLNENAVQLLGLDEVWLERASRQASAECERLHRELRGELDKPELMGREIVLTDDGMATGSSMRAAIQATRAAHAARIVVAVPVLAPEARSMLEREGVEHCYLGCPLDFHAVGQFYADFRPVGSAQVRAALMSRG
jgi:putative phosphoribosyl transferase